MLVIRPALSLGLAFALVALAPSLVRAEGDETKAACEELVDATGSALLRAVITSNPFNNNTENSGYYLTFHCNNLWFEARQIKYWAAGKRPNKTIAIKRYERARLIRDKIAAILFPPALVELEGLPTRHPNYPIVKRAWDRVTAAMTKVETLLSGAPPPPPAPEPAPEPSPTPSPAPAPAPADTPASQPAPADAPASTQPLPTADAPVPDTPAAN